MGNDTSIPVPVPANDAYVAVSFQMFSKIRVINAPSNVVEVFKRLEYDINEQYGFPTGRYVEDYFGTLKMIIGSYSGMHSTYQRTKIARKTFAIRCFEEMHKLGYSFSQSCDLSRNVDLATLYFYKNPIICNQTNLKVCCIDTGRTGMSYLNNKLILVNHDAQVKSIVARSISESWPKGLEKEEEKNISNTDLHYFVLRGYWGGTHEDGINTRLLLCNLVGNMAAHHWRLLCSTNMEGDSDTFFFVYEEMYSASPQDFIALTLAKHDRLRLINCQFLEQPLSDAVKAAGQNILRVEDYYNTREIVISGNPWWCSGEEAIRARRTISRIMETFNSLGWSPMTAVDISKRLSDKTTFLFQRSSAPMQVQFGAISNTDTNTMRLLDFPADIRDALVNDLKQMYGYGIATIEDIGGGNVKIKFNQWCWIFQGMSKGAPMYHIRAAIGSMMKTGETFGWYPTLSADISAKFVKTKNSEYSIDVHTIYLSKPVLGSVGGITDIKNSFLSNSLF